ncbi:mechanosensitive ion channel family protein [Sulfurospirillum sp. 1307]|jgi:small conductance mechanosensitive channel
MEQELQEVTKFYNTVIEFITNYSFQILGALIILLIGIVASKYIQRYTIKLLQKTKLDEIIVNFISNFVRFLVIAMMGILALGKLGISIAPFIAALGAASLTAGLALQGSVSNFAAGVVLIITKPFKIDDTITVHGVFGQVQDIKLAYTVLINEDKEQITIPNKYMIGDVLVNSFSYRLVEGSVGIAYDSDTQKAIELIKNVLLNHDEVSKDNEPIVGIEKFANSSVDIGYRYWAPTNSYFKVQYAINQEVFNVLKKENIDIPFSQMEIRMLS